MLQVKLLGQCDVRLDGQRIVIPSRAGQSLFAYLLLTTGAIHRREKLAGLFWPETPESQARHSLRQELWRMRKALSSSARDGTDYLLSEELSLGFNPHADCWLDVAQLQQPIAPPVSVTELANQLSVYRGELLPGFYDDWVVLERERIQALFESKMEQFMHLLVAEQRWAAVLDWAERWIALGYAPESAYRALMLAYGAIGDRAKAMATFERCADAMRKAFAVEPGRETTSLYQRLKEEQVEEQGHTTSRSPQSPALNLLVPAASSRALHDEPPAPGEPPFKGMQHFDEADAPLFFGREMLTANLLGHLREHALLVIVGASGSGKSSIARAGLVPALKRAEPVAGGSLPPEGSAPWQYHVITPTAHPLEALAASLAPTSTAERNALTAVLAREPLGLYLYARQKLARTGTLPARNGQGSGASAQRIVLVIDQFEELFTLCHDEFEREAFIDNVITTITLPQGRGGARGSPDAPVSVIITLRADFYGHLAQYPELRGVVAEHQSYIGPMSTDELRRAIEEPARAGAWDFEPGLVDLILRDVGAEPGALPLLSHALLETWKRRSDRRLTLKGYADAGGVRGAIAHTAETTYATFSPAQQAIARSIFLRLTELGEGTQDTRRRVPVRELVGEPGQSSAVEEVLRLLADARLITIDDDSIAQEDRAVRVVADTGRHAAQGMVEVAHEALIREWQRLRTWLNQDRDGLRMHRQLTEAAREWEVLGRDPGALYRGARLSQLNEWCAADPARLNELERAFLQASNEWAEREAAEREAQRQRELAAARQLAETQSRAARQLRRRAHFLASSFVLAVVLAGIALFLGAEARSSASVAQANAADAQQSKDEADRQRLAAESERRAALSRELAAVSVSNLDVEPQRSLLLALQAVSVTYAADRSWTVEAENALHRAVLAARVPLALKGGRADIEHAMFSPDGKQVATSSNNGTTTVWDARSGNELFSVPTDRLKLPVTAPAFSRDGARLATLGHGPGETAAIEIWDTTSGRLLRSTKLPVALESINYNAFSPDWSLLATSHPDGQVDVWDMATGRLQLVLSAHAGEARGLAFSPDGRRLAAGSSDITIRIWDLESGQEQRVLTIASDISVTELCSSCSSGLRWLAFSPDGTRLAASLGASSSWVWDLTTGKQILSLGGHTTGVGAVAFNPDGTRLATGTADGHTMVWDAMTGRELFTLVGANFVNAIAFSPDGQRLTTAANDGAASIWDLSPGSEGPKVTTGAGPILAFAQSSDGTRLATSQPDNSVTVWNAASGAKLLTLRGHSGPVSRIAFSADGTRLATASADMTAKVWDLSTGEPLVMLSGHTQAVNGVAFSADGARVATASSDTTARVWDAATGRELFNLSLVSRSANSVAFSPDGTRLVVTGSNSDLKVWDLSTGRVLFSSPYHAGDVWDAQFSPDGRRLVTAGADGTARVIDAVTGRGLLILFGHSQSVTRAVFNADGTRIATASDDGTVKTWDAASGQEILTLYGPNEAVSGVAFSPDGTRLVTSGADGIVRSYWLQIHELISLARSRLTRSWTAGECLKFLHTEQCPPSP